MCPLWPPRATTARAAWRLSFRSPERWVSHHNLAEHLIFTARTEVLTDEQEHQCH